MTHGLLRFILLAVLGGAVFFMLATTHADPDLWGHLRFGLDILEHRQLDAVDPYSFTSDREWINHEWLSEIAFAAAWLSGGSPGLIVLKLGVIAGTVLLVVRTLNLRRVGRDARLILVGLVLAGIYPRVLYVRPQLFSVLLFAALAWTLTRAEQGSRRALAFCPLIFALWANFHGGWITGLGSLAIWAAVDAYERRHEGKRAGEALGWLAVSAAASLLNPYGIGLWRFLLETVRPGRESIGEWGPAWNEPAVLVVWLLLAWLTAAAAYSAGLARVRRRLAVPVFWGIASLAVVRLDAFFALSVVGFLGADIERFLGRARERPSVPRLWRAAVLGAVLLLALTFPAARAALTCVWMQPAEWPEPGSVRFMHDNDFSGRLLTYFNWGQYAIWHVPPGIKVSMDGRRETVYSGAMISGHLRLYAGSEEGVSFAEGLQADYAWLPAGTLAAELLKGRGWSTAFEGDRSIILVSPAMATAPPFMRSASQSAESPRCFPGP